MAGVIPLNSGQGSSERHTTTGILVDPSGTAWACVLTDSTGKVIFQAGGAADEPFFAPVRVSSDAFNMTTATNITKVCIYV